MSTREPIPFIKPLIVFVFFLFFDLSVNAESPPKRIVSMAPSYTEILYALGLNEEIVGTSNYCNYPPQAENTERIGDALNPNLEKILSLQPDLVFCGGWKWNVPEQLRKVGINVVEIRDAVKLSEVYDLIRMVAVKVQREKQGALLVSDMKSRIENVRLRTSQVKVKKRAYVEIDGSQWTAGGSSYLNEVLETAGLINIFGDRSEPYLMVTMESIASRDPDVILSFWQNKEYYLNSPAWRAVHCVRNGATLDKDAMLWDTVTRQGPRLAEGIETLEKLILLLEERTAARP